MSYNTSNEQYEVRDDIPILDEHVLHDEEGNVIAEITVDKLERIARNNNRKIQETGDEVPLIIGHTKDGLPESEQPEIVGYADKFRVKWLFNTGRKAIFARLKYFKDRADVIRQFPRRSVELWLRKLEIDPISLLGATTPERALGLLKYSNDGLHYSHQVEDQSQMDGQGDNIVQQVLAALQQTAEWQQFKQLLSQLGQGQQQQAQGQEQGGQPQQMASEQYADEDPASGIHFDAEDYEEQDYAGVSTGPHSQPASVRKGLANMHPTIAGKSPMRPKFDAEDYDEQDYDAAEEYDDEAYAANASRSISAQVGGTASPTARGGSTQTFGPRNNFPGHVQSRQLMGKGNMISTVPHRSLPISGTSRLQRDGLLVKLARLERNGEIQNQVNKHLVLKLRRAEREKDLIQLDAENVMFDRDEEFGRGMRMSDQTWNDHVQLMRARYQRAPINSIPGLNSALDQSRTNAPDAQRGHSRDEMHDIVNHAMQTGKSYEAAQFDLESRGRTL